jgi:uncharacterized tellurite resistance protein B-like protein
MDADTGELCVRVICSVAWADGTVSDEEMGRIIDIVLQLDYVEAPRIQEILAIPCRFNEVERVRALDRNTRLRLLHDAYLVASLTEIMGESELAILRQIAATIVPENRWPDVESCLRAYADYERRCRGLWGVTHLG